MKVFQIRLRPKSGPILAGARYQPDLQKRPDFGRSQSRTPVQPYRRHISSDTYVSRIEDIWKQEVEQRPQLMKIIL